MSYFISPCKKHRNEFGNHLYSVPSECSKCISTPEDKYKQLQAILKQQNQEIVNLKQDNKRLREWIANNL